MPLVPAPPNVNRVVRFCATLSWLPIILNASNMSSGSQSITNVDEYLRALTPDATAGYASIYYANANGVSYSQHNNRYYVIAVTPLSGGGGDV